jgi:hypothetical protein
LVVFIGGWNLFESDDPILMEIGVAFILAIFMTAINEVLTQHQNKIKALEEKIAELDKSLSSKESLYIKYIVCSFVHM